MLLHTDAFTHKHFHTHRGFYTQTLLHTEACTHRSFYTQTLLHRRFSTQTLSHTETFTHRSFYTQKFLQTLLHTEALTHRSFYTETPLHTDAFTHIHTHTLLQSFTHRSERVAPDASKSQSYLSFSRSNLISCERVRRTFCKSQSYLSFWRSNLISCERVLGPDLLQIAILPQFLAIEPHFAILPQFSAIEPHFVRKGFATGPFANRNLTSVFGDRTSFRAKGFAGPFASYLCFRRSNSFRAKGLRSNKCKSKSQFYLSFWRSNLVTCERVAFRAVSLALPRTFKIFKREKEKKERARGQESKRARENVKMWGCEDVRMWGWEDVRMLGWEDVKMWKCLTDPHY